jgi:hypothetical protein
MAMFVHLTPETRLPSIRRNGIGRLRRGLADRPAGLFAMPVTRNFYVSHQWLRELKRGRNGPMAGVYFRLPDEQKVWVGHYGQGRRWMTAAEAVAEFMADANREGWEVVIPRRIEAKEIHRTRRLPQVLGWRYFPGAKGKKPMCTCEYCVGGNYGAAKLRKRFPPP